MKVIRDPVHDLIEFDKKDDELLLKLIDTQEFQRLRHIKQLGVAAFTYPGAEHTRFAHSLGVTHLMKRFIQKILSLKDPEICEYQQQIEEHKMLALTAALLHDIGHGPFSHAIESTTGINHETFSIAIIDGDTEINAILENYRPGFSKEVVDVIRRTHRDKAVVKLLSSQMDVDRIDYLLRDSKMTGARYGTFDLEWMINVLRIGKYQDEVEVGLDLEKGLSIAEDFVMARYYMYKHVYFHKTTRNVELIIGKILKRALELDEQGKLSLDDDLKQLLQEKSINPTLLKSFLNMTDHSIWHYIFKWSTNKDPILRELCENLLQRNLHKSIKITKESEFYRKMFQLLEKENIKEDYIYSKDTPSTSYYKDDYISNQPKDDEEGVEKEASEHIVLFDSDGQGFELSRKSDIIKMIRNETLELTRIYVLRKYYRDLIGG